MAKKKNMKADKPEFGGCIIFDGNIQVRIPQHGIKTLRTDFGGFALRKADPNKELLVLTRNHVGYNEIDTGYIVRTKNYDNGQPPYFGLKDEPDAEGWGCHNYCDVIAWGYADGGLNDPTLYYSCQSTVEEEKLKVTLQDFLDFTKAHPEFKEMHFYTEPTEWENEEEEEAGE